MASKKLQHEFFKRDTHHGVVKRVMYKKYLQAFMAKTQNARLRSVIIDGFAGPGRYSNKWPEAIEDYGSPLIALMVVLEDGVRKKKTKSKESALNQGIAVDTSLQEIPGYTTYHQDITGDTVSCEEITGDTTYHKDITGDTISHQEIIGDTTYHQDITGDTTSHQEINGDTTYHQDINEDTISYQEITGDTTYHQDITGDTVSYEEITGDTTYHKDITGDTISHQEITGDTTYHQDINEDTITHQDITGDETYHQDITGDTTSHQDITEFDTEHPRPIFGWESCDESPIEELDKIDKMQRGDSVDMHTNVSIILIEEDKINYETLLCDIELLINKFLRRHFSDVEYNVTEGKGESKFSITMEPFSVSINVHDQLFEEHEPPSDLLECNVRSLTFLDPYGYSHTPMDHVERFAPGDGNEVIINFMSSYVNRFVKERPKLVARLYGIDTADMNKDNELGRFIEYVIKESDNDTNADTRDRNSVQKCVDSYEQFLKSKTNSTYSLVFEVRGKRNQIKYHMIHITNHICGVEAMKMAMVKCSQQEGEMRMSDYDIIRKGMKLNFKKSQNDRVVADIIFEKFKGMENILVEPSAFESNRRGTVARIVGKRLYDMFPTVKEYVLLETNYCLWKRPLALLQKEYKIGKVTENGEPQKSKNRFPDKDTNGRHMETRLWFEQNNACLSNKENVDLQRSNQENSTQEQTSTAGTTDHGVGKRARQKPIYEYCMLQDKLAGTNIPKETLIGCAKPSLKFGHEKHIVGNTENSERQKRKRGSARGKVDPKPENQKKRRMSKSKRIDETGPSGLEKPSQRKIYEYFTVLQ